MWRRGLMLSSLSWASALASHGGCDSLRAPSSSWCLLAWVWRGLHAQLRLRIGKQALAVGAQCLPLAPLAFPRKCQPGRWWVLYLLKGRAFLQAIQGSPVAWCLEAVTERLARIVSLSALRRGQKSLLGCSLWTTASRPSMCI